MKSSVPFGTGVAVVTCTERFRSCRASDLLKSRGLDDASAKLVALERLEQRLEVAFAETFVAFALDELEKNRSQHRSRENLQQQPLLSIFGRAVEQNSTRLKFADVLAMTRQPLVEHFVVRRGRRGHQRHAGLLHAVPTGQEIIGQQRDV